MSLFKSTKQLETCPKCQSVLQIRKGKQGLFLGCSRYPDCDYLKPLHQATHIIRDLEELCPDCGAFLQLKQGNYGIFIGCSAYPECHFMVHNEPEIEESFDCPECKTHKLVARTGRLGKTFYGCSGFPTCKFTLASKPVLQRCPQCDCQLAIIKKIKGKNHYLCANKHCQHSWSME